MPECDFCDMTYTIEHRLFYWVEAKGIWKSIQNWIENTFEIHISFTICEVICGIPINIDEYTLVINYIILFAKWYINKKKEQEKNIITVVGRYECRP